MLEIVICEDNPKLLESYESMIYRIIRDHELDACIKFCATSAEEVAVWLKHHRANFFILDIDLRSNQTGMELAQSIRSIFPRSYILFISAHLQYVFQSFDVQPFNFLPKPVSHEILEANIIKVYKDSLERETESVQKILTLRHGGTLQNLKVCDIIAMERMESKTILHLGQRSISCNEPLTELFNRLADPRFIRCHKSYIFNVDYVKEYRFSKNEILMENGLCVFIGRNYKKELIKRV